jgi:rhodanese-related sulfurtransferase
MLEQIKAADLATWLKDENRAKPFLLDVRELWEFAHCAIAGAVSMPMGSVPGRTGELDTDREIVCICHHGMRSQQVAMFLSSVCMPGPKRLYQICQGTKSSAPSVLDITEAS